MRCLLAVFVALCAHSGRTPAAFQSQTQSAKQAQSIQAVMDFRNGFLKDTTRVDLCLLKSIHDDIARSFPDLARRLAEPSATHCETRLPARVALREIVADSGVVRGYTKRGEASYAEEYSVIYGEGRAYLAGYRILFIAME